MGQHIDQSDKAALVSARVIAERWSCHVDTVYARLAQAGVPEIRFSSRFIRWRWEDVLLFEETCATGRGVARSDESLEPPTPSRKRGPRRLAAARSRPHE